MAAKKGGKPAAKDNKKGAAEKKGKKRDDVWNKYKVSGDKVERTNESCPKCGEGTFLAKHKNRKTCGKCAYVEFI
ncbi:30S ribosomal protein S27ae [Candidatus Woesearchaeota archaeon]|nr:30S ribosomal protein S27ae [Candidatus Woesearchaeota archaeon]